MTSDSLNTPVRIFDPRGIVETEPRGIAPRLASLEGARLTVLDNSKWNAGRLLRSLTDALTRQANFSEVHHFTKESFSKLATPELLDEMVETSDVVLTAIGD